MDKELLTKLDKILAAQEVEATEREETKALLNEIIEKLDNLSREGVDYETASY